MKIDKSLRKMLGKAKQNSSISILPDGKKVIFKSKRNNLSPNQIYNVYKKIPDDRKVPIVFQTKKQYLNEYIKNQEIKHKIDFPKKQEQAYIKRELKDMRPIISRYTTKKNKYMEPRTVFFTDTKWTPESFKRTAQHECGHEIWERNKNIRQDWKSVNKNTSPTMYGKTDKQEDFADSYMLHKNNQLPKGKRLKIMKDIKSNNYIYLTPKKYRRKEVIAQVNRGSPGNIFINTWQHANKWPIKAVAGVLDHEETHRILEKEHDEKTSKQLDNIVPGAAISQFNNKLLNPNTLFQYNLHPKKQFREYVTERNITKENLRTLSDKETENLISDYDKQYDEPKSDNQSENDVYYHVTHKKNINNIMQKGLIPSDDPRGGKGIFVFNNFDDAKSLSSSSTYKKESAIVKINLPDDMEKKVIPGLYSEEYSDKVIDIETPLSTKYLSIYKDEDSQNKKYYNIKNLLKIKNDNYSKNNVDWNNREDLSDYYKELEKINKYKLEKQQEKNRKELEDYYISHPQNTEPQNTEPQNTEPQNTEPQNTEPEDINWNNREDLSNLYNELEFDKLNREAKYRKNRKLYLEEKQQQKNQQLNLINQQREIQKSPEYLDSLENDATYKKMLEMLNKN